MPVLSQGGITGDNLGLTTLINGSFTGGSPAGAAIQSRGGLFVRNVHASGYSAAINDNGSLVPGKAISEYASGSTLSLFSAADKGLNLPQSQIPQWNEPVSRWKSVVEFGANPGGTGDSTAAIQRAIDSGARTIYFPSGKYVVSSTIHIRGSIRHVVGFQSFLALTGEKFGSSARPTPVLSIESGAAPNVTIDGLHGSAPPPAQSTFWMPHPGLSSFVTVAGSPAPANTRT